MDFLVSAGVSVAFIGSFYVWPRERCFFRSAVKSLSIASSDPTIYVDRSSYETIRRRTISFGMCCVLSSAYLASDKASPLVLESRSTFWWPVIRSFVSTLLLFTGPLTDAWYLGTLVQAECALMYWRNYVICPLGEELFYRGVLFSLLHRRSSATRIGVSSLLFALSHTHHLVSLASVAYRDSGDLDLDERGRLAKERACWLSASCTMCGILVFTSLFGLLSGYYYEHVCEGSIVAIAAAHALCNVIGPPEFVILRSSQLSVRKRVASAAVYIAGVVGWALMLVLF
ncbi:hypothetical protein JKF63_04327 [Porcisia hertigi]|uniref:intramembrane prenyl-peptidase Rce1 n=1 Tax=Porcisia hertigi TaxID=2761500 RepID=A0A836IE52_9TRYP|nr:hypothetical protein JKF63_04327 [Porcisia hertigi]